MIVEVASATVPFVAALCLTMAWAVVATARSSVDSLGAAHRDRGASQVPALFLPAPGEAESPTIEKAPLGSAQGCRQQHASPDAHAVSTRAARTNDHSAELLLHSLGKTRFTSQTFRDRVGATREPTIRHGPWEAQRRHFEDDNRHGMGIFMTVNRTDLRGRRTENVIEVVAYFADFDDTELPTSWPLAPTAVVESSPFRYHSYWRVLNAPRRLFTHVQKHLAALLGSDPRVHDLPRVMRLPGFVHAKGEPFVSRLVLVEPAIVYEHDEFVDAFAVPAVKPGVQQAKWPRPRPGAMKDYVWAAVMGEHRRVATAPEGIRNTTLHEAAVSLGTLVGAGVLAEADARDALLAGVNAAAVPLPASEAERTITSGVSYGRRHPRQLGPSDR